MATSVVLQSEADSGTVLVSGHIDFDSVLSYRQLGEKMILSTTQPELQFDLSKAEIGGSIGVSLLLSWLRCANNLDKKITFQQVPENLCEMIKVSGVQEILAFD